MVKGKKEIIETEEEVEEIEEVEEVEDDGIEIKEPPPRKAPQRKKETKPRPPKTAAQLATVAIMLEKKRQNTELRRLERQAIEMEHKKKLQDKILKTAVKIKKRQIKDERIIEEVSPESDDDSIQSIKKIVKKRATIKETVYLPQPPPRIIFK